MPNLVFHFGFSYYYVIFIKKIVFKKIKGFLRKKIFRKNMAGGPQPFFSKNFFLRNMLSYISFDVV